MERARPRREGVALMLTGAALTLASCKQRDAPAVTTLEITDDLGRRVALSRPARRIASLSPAHSESLFALGCGPQVVLRDRASSYPAAVAKLPATDPFRLSPDHLVGFSPDLVLMSHHDPGRLEALRRIGLATAVLDPKTFDGVLVNLVKVGRLCGAGQRARRLAAQLRRRVKAVRRAVAGRGRRRPRVYVEVDGSDPARPWTATPRSFVGHLLRVAGGDNVIARTVGGQQPYLQVSAEAIVRADPQVIVLAAPTARGTPAPGAGLARLRQRRGWQRISAVRAGRVIDTIHPDLLSRPGPRLVDGLEALATALGAPAARGGDGGQR